MPTSADNGNLMSTDPVEDGNVTNPSSPNLQQKRTIEEILHDAVTVVNDRGGMHALEWDVMRIASWAIAASTGAVSKAHHDAGGYLTFVEAQVGAKIWVYLVSKEQPRTMYQAMQDYHYIATHCTDSIALAKRVKPVYVYLAPGTLL